MNSKFVFGLVALAALAAFAPGLAAPADPQLDQGMRQVQEGELQPGIATLEGVVQRLEHTAAARHEVALAHVWIAIARLGLNQSNLARTSMAAAVQADPTLSLGADEFPPQVVLLFEDVRSQAASVAAAPSAAPAAKKKGGGKGLLIGGAVAVVGGGAALAAGGGGGGSVTTTTVPVTTAAVCTDPATSALPVFTFPVNGSTVRGVVSVSCPLPANFAQSCVDFVAYSVLPDCGRTFTLIGRPNTPPFSAVWDSATVPNGQHCLECGLWDKQGRPGPVQHITITVAN